MSNFIDFEQYDISMVEQTLNERYGKPVEVQLAYTKATASLPNVPPYTGNKTAVILL